MGILLFLVVPRIAHARMTGAPPHRDEMLAFATQPDPGDTDSTGVGIEKHEPKGTTTETPPPQNLPHNPAFDRPDTSKAGGFNSAPLETLGPSTTNRNFGNPTTPLPAASHVRRGIFGVHPLAILVGLVALHIFVVTSVVK